MNPRDMAEEREEDTKVANQICSFVQLHDTGTENREEWRKLVVKSTVVRQLSARRRDRYEDKKLPDQPVPALSPSNARRLTG